MPPRRRTKESLALPVAQSEQLNQISLFLLAASKQVGFTPTGKVLEALQKQLTEVSSSEAVSALTWAHNVAFHRIFAEREAGNQFALDFIRAHLPVNTGDVDKVRRMSEEDVTALCEQYGAEQQTDPVRQAIRALMLSPNSNFRHIGLVYWLSAPESTPLQLDKIKLKEPIPEPVNVGTTPADDLQRIQNFARNVWRRRGAELTDDDRIALFSDNAEIIKSVLARIGEIKGTPVSPATSPPPAETRPVLMKDDPRRTVELMRAANDIIVWLYERLEDAPTGIQQRFSAVFSEYHEVFYDESQKLARLEALMTQFKNIRRDYERHLTLSGRASGSPPPAPQSSGANALARSRTEPEQPSTDPWIVDILSKGDRKTMQRYGSVIIPVPLPAIPERIQGVRSRDMNGYGKLHAVPTPEQEAQSQRDLAAKTVKIGRPNLQISGGGTVAVKMTPGARSKRKGKK